MSQPMRPPDYFHFPTLLALHDAIESLDPAAAPRAALVSSQPDPGPTAERRVAILPGSFNPLHQGHVALAAAALESNAATEVWLGLARVTVDKEQIAGSLLEDRLVALRHFIQDQPRYGVLLFNRGLYVDQALAAHARWPGLDTLLFLVGYDKIVQIFDPRYYDDRDAALQKLFSLASFLVAPRDDATADDLAALLRRPENRPFAAGVRSLPLPSTVAAVSSTGLRQDLGAAAGFNLHHLSLGGAQGEGQGEGPIPPGVSLPQPFADMVAATHAYAPPPAARHRAGRPLHGTCRATHRAIPGPRVGAGPRRPAPVADDGARTNRGRQRPPRCPPPFRRLRASAGAVACIDPVRADWWGCVGGGSRRRRSAPPKN